MCVCVCVCVYEELEICLSSSLNMKKKLTVFLNKIKNNHDGTLFLLLLSSRKKRKGTGKTKLSEKKKIKRGHISRKKAWLF